MPTPVFTVTQTGLNAANAASPTGPFINVVSFKVGDAYGYVPNISDSDIHGNLLYQSAPTTWRNMGDGTIDIQCQIPATAGPFNYGEVGLYVDDGTGTDYLFALAAFDEPQTKYSSLGTNVATSETFHCLLRLAQSTAIFQFSTAIDQSIQIFDRWSDVAPPGLSANPDVPLCLVTELDTFECSSLLTLSDDNRWTVGTNYARIATATVSNASSTSVTVPTTAFGSYNAPTSTQRQYVLEFADHWFRSVSTAVDNGNGTVTMNLNPDPLVDLPDIGSTLIIYTNQPYSTTYASTTAYGEVKIGDGIVVSNGVISAHGFLHDGANTGRVLTSADNLNLTTYASGLYTASTASIPSGLPTTGISGHLWIQNTNTWITQIFWPIGLSGGGGAQDSTPYYRCYTGSTWSGWRQIITQINGLYGNVGLSAGANVNVVQSGNGWQISANVPAGINTLLGSGNVMPNLPVGLSVVVNEGSFDWQIPGQAPGATLNPGYCMLMYYNGGEVFPSAAYPLAGTGGGGVDGGDGDADGA